MFGYRTPAKMVNKPDPKDALNQTVTVKAGPSKVNETTSKVRKSIGEWESGKPEGLTKAKTTPKKNVAPTTAPVQKSKQTLSQTTQAAESPKYANRVAEAKACLLKAKLHLGNSRNLKTDIKIEVTQAIERLYALVKEAENDRTRKDKDNPGREETRKDDMEEGRKETAAAASEVPSTALVHSLLEGMKEHGRLMAECKQHTASLADRLQSFPPAGAEPAREVSYAAVAAKKPTHTHTMHSIIVSGEGETSGEVVDKIRSAVDAKGTGIRVDRIRKARDQKVIIGCKTKDEIDKVTQRIKDAGTRLQVEGIKNKDPLVILKDVMAYNTDEDIIAALRNQNDHLLRDIPTADQRILVRYRRKTKNPHANHIVLQVSPQLWLRLTTAERVHVDLQLIRVTDQSPLVQCSLCLAYGHGRRFCTETTKKCSHCGGPHIWTECEDRLVGAEPTCCNCTQAKMPTSNHNAFSIECTIRRKWDALARATVAYS